jgi:hypothetical protein
MGAFDKEDRWDEQITSIQVGINGSLSNAIGVSPMEFQVVSNGMFYDEESEVVGVKEERDMIMSEFENFFLCERILINLTTCLNETSS